MRLKKIFRYLESEYTSSFFDRGSDPFFVLIFTVLSQRTRDENTEKVTAALFKRYDTPKKLLDTPLDEVEKLIKGSGFYHVKAKRIKEISRQILDEYGGKVPDNREDLLKLTGVGPKTAACVLVYGFRKQAIPVDTHVHRISNRLGLIDTKTPEQSEIELMKVIPKKYWIDINEYMVKFGKNKCTPLRPWCSKCALPLICPFYKNTKGKNR